MGIPANEKKGIHMYDPLQDIHHYNKTLTISQVVKFCEKKELGITRAMVQNYIRDGLLPPPVNKRYYTHKHLAGMVVIAYLKTIFDMSDIKTALTPLLDEEGLPLETYRLLMDNLMSISEIWRTEISSRLFDASVSKDMSLLLLMAHAADLRALSCELITRTAPPEGSTVIEET